jgi:hypothetical protein
VNAGTRIIAAELGVDSGILGACILPYTLSEQSTADKPKTAIQ